MQRSQDGAGAADEGRDDNGGSCQERELRGREGRISHGAKVHREAGRRKAGLFGLTPGPRVALGGGGERYSGTKVQRSRSGRKAENEGA